MSNGSGVNIEHLVELARIELSTSEKEKLRDNLVTILDYFRELSKLDVDGVEESAHAFPIYNVLRDDEIGPMFSVENALLNAPERDGNQFAVPKVVE
jgi:aspartyl-tRNA(Asn)/glutamyl-tRNA(Gln) amidotransferase subunit C